MRALLARCAYRKAIGLYAADQKLTFSRVALTPLGPVELERRSEPYAADELPDALGRLLDRWINGPQRLRDPIVVGLPTLRVFFSTRPIQTTNQDADPRILLHEVLQSPTINIDDMAVDVIKAIPSKRPVASIVSCRRRYLSGVLAALDSYGLRPSRVEPAPCALLRLAARKHRVSRKKTALFVFLGASQALAVLVAGEHPLIWRVFDLPPGEESNALVSTARALQILGKYCGIESAFDLVILLGRHDLGGAADVDALAKQLGIRVVHHAGPGLDDGEIAFGLALGGQPMLDGFDLARTLKPRASLRDIFPWGELAVQAAILVCIALFLNHQARSLEGAERMINAEAAQHAWMKPLGDAQLEAERRALTQKLEAIRTFHAGRILWTAYTHDIGERLPANIVLKSFQGQSELAAGGKRAGAVKPKKSFALRFVAPIPAGGPVPKEVDNLLDALRADPLLKRDFPIIELGDLKSSQARSGARGLAEFSVVCLPGAVGGPSKPPPGGAAGTRGAKK